MSGLVQESSAAPTAAQGRQAAVPPIGARKRVGRPRTPTHLPSGERSAAGT
jgi:hypothetical protein